MDPHPLVQRLALGHLLDLCPRLFRRLGSLFSQLGLHLLLWWHDRELVSGKQADRDGLHDSICMRPSSKAQRNT